MPPSPDGLNAAILIVDDQESNVRLLEHTLRRGGYVAVTSTTDAREVCPLHRENRYDLIILDLQMPRMNGFEVMQALKAAEGAPSTSILVMTADPSMMVLALKAGAAGFISKPFVLTEVLRRIGEILDQSGGGRSAADGTTLAGHSPPANEGWEPLPEADDRRQHGSEDDLAD